MTSQSFATTPTENSELSGIEEPTTPVNLNIIKNENKYNIRPQYSYKFKSDEIETLIKTHLNESLDGKVYDVAESGNLSKNLTVELLDKIKEVKKDRYKYLVQIVICEQRGQGTKLACRCFWDNDCDNLASYTFCNDSIICTAIVFGVYYY